MKNETRQKDQNTSIEEHRREGDSDDRAPDLVEEESTVELDELTLWEITDPQSSTKISPL